MKNYKCSVLKFCQIGNIHTVRGSYKFVLIPIALFYVCLIMQLVDAISAQPDNWYESVEKTGWLGHQQSILKAAVLTANSLEDKISVVVHCSDGWDRTAQIVHYLLHSYFRLTLRRPSPRFFSIPTIERSKVSLLIFPSSDPLLGFIVLIEKEWLSFGHKFTSRVGFSSSIDKTEMSPVFHQCMICFLCAHSPSPLPHDSRRVCVSSLPTISELF